jgi:hypothetical protein
MGFDGILQWLESTPIAIAISEGDTLFPLLEAIHVLAITMVVGSILIVDLRLVGLASTGRKVERVLGEVLPLTWGAFVVAACSGLLLFASKAVTYGHNAFFLRKMVLLALAGINMMVFHFVTGRHIAVSSAGTAPPLAAKVAGVTSMLLWFGIVACGRWIGFTLH